MAADFVSSFSFVSLNAAFHSLLMDLFQFICCPYTKVGSAVNLDVFCGLKFLIFLFCFILFGLVVCLIGFFVVCFCFFFFVRAVYYTSWVLSKIKYFLKNQVKYSTILESYKQYFEQWLFD